MITSNSTNFLHSKYWGVGSVFVLVLFAALAANGQSRFPREVLSPNLWEKIETPAQAECDGSPSACAKEFLLAAGKSVEPKISVKTYRLGERDGRNLTIVIITSKITDDDSLTGIRYRLAISLGDVEDRTYKLETLGQQFTCARGHKYWSKSRCP